MSCTPRVMGRERWSVTRRAALCLAAETRRPSLRGDGHRRQTDRRQRRVHGQGERHRPPGRERFVALRVPTGSRPGGRCRPRGAPGADRARRRWSSSRRSASSPSWSAVCGSPERYGGGRMPISAFSRRSWARMVDPVARRVLPGVRTHGAAGTDAAHERCRRSCPPRARSLADRLSADADPGTRGRGASETLGGCRSELRTQVVRCATGSRARSHPSRSPAKSSGRSEWRR
jgi:hypothetical protein